MSGADVTQMIDAISAGDALAAEELLPLVFMYDISNATNFAGNGTINAQGGQISPGGVLNPAITPAVVVQSLNQLNSAELTKFNFNLNKASPDELTFSERWEGMSLVPALDPANPKAYREEYFHPNAQSELFRRGLHLIAASWRVPAALLMASEDQADGVP